MFGRILPGRKREWPTRRVGTGKGGTVLVQLTVERRVAENGWDVRPGLGNRDALDKFGGIVEIRFAGPLLHSARTGIISRQGVFGNSTQPVQDLSKVIGAVEQADLG